MVVIFVRTCSNKVRRSGVSDSVDDAAGRGDASATEAVSFRARCDFSVIALKKNYVMVRVADLYRKHSSLFQ